MNTLSTQIIAAIACVAILIALFVVSNYYARKLGQNDQTKVNADKMDKANTVATAPSTPDALSNSLQDGSF